MSGVRLAKPWLDLDEAAIAALPGQLGVYEIADARGVTLELGFAGGRSRFGLRSAIAEAAANHEGASRFRYEVTFRTTTVRDRDDWILDGERTLTSSADKADFGIVFARTDPELGRKGITCFLVDTDIPGFRVRRIVHTLRSSHYAAELEFN